MVHWTFMHLQYVMSYPRSKFIILYFSTFVTLYCENFPLGCKREEKGSAAQASFTVNTLRFKLFNMILCAVCTILIIFCGLVQMARRAKEVVSKASKTRYQGAHQCCSFLYNVKTKINAIQNCIIFKCLKGQQREMFFCPFDLVQEGDIGSDFIFGFGFWSKIRRDRLSFMSIGVFSIYGKLLSAYSALTFIFFKCILLTP